MADILLADDELAVRKLLKGVLEGRGYVVRTAANGDQALGQYHARRPDLLLLDVMMPCMGGLEVCRAIRREDPETPIVFLTALDSEADEIRGLGVGADAYVAKTVSEDVLLARIAAALRRSEGVSADFAFGDWRVEALGLVMRSKSGDEVALTEREVAMLRAFALHPGEVFSRDGLLTQFWGRGSAASESTVNVAMFKLRAKLGADGDGIEAVRGVGYVYRPRRRAIVSLGSNIEPRKAYLKRALAALCKMPRTRLVAASPVEETEPVDVPPEFASLRFLNQVAVFDTSLDPRDFSRRMHRIEDALDRVRTVRNGPRTIDIDLIDFGGLVISEPELTLPHPRAMGRAFVMRPLEKMGIRLGGDGHRGICAAMSPSVLEAVLPDTERVCVAIP